MINNDNMETLLKKTAEIEKALANPLAEPRTIIWDVKGGYSIRRWLWKRLGKTGI